MGFYPRSKENKIAKPFSNFPEKQPVKKSFHPIVTCFYCMKKGHSVRYCRFRKSLVPKGIYKWIPRCIVNTKDKSNFEGPKFFKGSNLKIWQSSVLQISHFFRKVQQGLDVLYLSTYQSLVLVPLKFCNQKISNLGIKLSFFVKSYQCKNSIQYASLCFYEWFPCAPSSLHMFYSLQLCENLIITCNMCFWFKIFFFQNSNLTDCFLETTDYFC